MNNPRPDGWPQGPASNEPTTNKPRAAASRECASQRPEYDVLVVGGGINGAGIARDLSGRGLRVLLGEQDDLASHTSSSSTKVIHGGLRYLKYFEFSLVRKALAEREVLLKSAPHKPLRGAWTAKALLPGGDLGGASDGVAGFSRFVQALTMRHPELPAALCRRLARCYGSRVETLLTKQGPGAEVAPGLFEAELHYLYHHEWARTADHVLWRRTKLGLHPGEAQRAAVAAWCAKNWNDSAAGATPAPENVMETACN